MNYFKLLFFLIFYFISVQLFSEDTSSDEFFGNRWYSRANFYSYSNLEMGVSGTKDYLIENSIFSYKFRSTNKNLFGIRFNHTGFFTGILSKNNNYNNFGFMIGFEYMYKIFSQNEGIFFIIDIGGSNSGFALYSAIGVGNRFKTFIELNFTIFINSMILSSLIFNILIFEFFSLMGVIGIDATFKESGWISDIFSFKTGGFICFSVKSNFKIEIGGGITLNDYYALRGFGKLGLVFSFP